MPTARGWVLTTSALHSVSVALLFFFVSFLSVFFLVGEDDLSKCISDAPNPCVIHVKAQSLCMKRDSNTHFHLHYLALSSLRSCWHASTCA